MVPRMAVVPGKRHVPPYHQKAATLPNILRDASQGIWSPLRSLQHVRVKEQGICRYVTENHDMVARQLVEIGRELMGCFMVS